MNKRLTIFWSLLAACFGVVTALPSRAASLQSVTADWGTNGVPTNVSMYIYVPDTVVTNPPILVLLHYWGGGASGVFAEAQWGGIVAAADQYGFIMVVPQTPDCWDANSTQSLTHNGGGQTEAIAHMVNYTITRYHANADRVYVTGTSCGGMMTEALLAAYPDIFKAGAAFAGQAVGGAWTPVTHTAQQWGDIVRNTYPGYTGRRPRVQLWHGTADGIINYSNQLEAIMQWGNVLGLSVNPTTTTTGVKIGNITNAWTHQVWKDSCGNTLLDAWSEIGGGHGTDANLNAQYVIPFLGLDHIGPTDPVSPCDRPGGLAATAITPNLIKLTWNAFTNAISYNVKRSTISGGPYMPIALGIGSNCFTDAVSSVRGGYCYVVSAMVGGNETPDSPEAAVSFAKLTGAIIGTAGSYNNSGNTIAKVFDNNLSTFFDAPDPGNGDWVGLDFGVGVSNVITQINYCPRSGFESRMVGGTFQGANRADFSGAVTLGTVGTQPPSGGFTSATATNLTAFRYVRYLAPNSSWGNVAELEFHGYLFFPPTIPVMGVAEAGTNLTLTWPLASAGFTLQSCTNLFLGDWMDVTSPAPQIVGGQWQVPMPQSGNIQPVFYRLSK
jgi:acetylxylan esterase